MKEFDEFLKLAEKSIKLDPWVKKAKTIEYCKEIINETNEAILAIEKKDIENLEEELADIFYDWVHTCLKAKEEYGLEISNIINSANKKLSHRKPYLLENKQVSLEESLKIWKEQKAKEKNK